MTQKETLMCQAKSSGKRRSMAARAVAAAAHMACVTGGNCDGWAFRQRTVPHPFSILDAVRVGNKSCPGRSRPSQDVAGCSC